MTLARFFRFHCVVTWPFAIPMVLTPGWFLDLVTTTEPGPLAIDLSRLVGAAYLFIALLTWTAPRRLSSPDQLLLARVFFFYETLGLLVGFTIDFDAHGDLARWLTVGFFAIFSVGYLWFGFLAPRVTAGARGSG